MAEKTVSRQTSIRNSTIASIVVAVLMILLRPIFRISPETTFLGGFFGAILFFFLLIMYGNKREDKNPGSKLGWVQIGFCEAGAMIVSLFIHPVCITTCVLFSIPVIIYIKGAETQIRIQTQQKTK